MPGYHGGKKTMVKKRGLGRKTEEKQGNLKTADTKL